MTAAAPPAGHDDRGQAGIALHGQARLGEQLAEPQAHRQIVAPGAVELPVTLVQVFQIRVASREPQGGGVDVHQVDTTAGDGQRGQMGDNGSLAPAVVSKHVTAHDHVVPARLQTRSVGLADFDPALRQAGCCCRAMATAPGSASMPTACPAAPTRSASIRSTAPGPHPASATRAPGTMPAASHSAASLSAALAAIMR